MSKYLLIKISNQEGIHFNNDYNEIPKALQHNTTIKLNVNLSEFIYIKEDLSDESQSELNPIHIKLQVGLEKCPDDVIRQVLSAVHQQFHCKLETQSIDYKFSLKFSDVNEYLTGKASILTYKRVQMSLRGYPYLELDLTQILKFKKIGPNWPPIFERTYYQDEVSAQGNLVPGELFEQAPFFFHAKMSEQHSNLIETGTSELTPRLQIKENILQFVEQRRAKLEQFIIQDKQILYSGECDYQFQIKIVGIADIQPIFDLDDVQNEKFSNLTEGYKRRATYNGDNIPSYITKQSTYKHGTKQREPKEELLKLKSIVPIDSKQLTVSKSNFSPHMMQHGGSGSAHMDYLQSRYELDFSPYLISIQIILMYGQTPLTKYSTQQTPKIPFRKLCRWDSQFQFSGMKISQLPMELRMCFNVIMHSSSAEEQIIASTMTEVFDENGKFKQGRLELNLWPFYKIDSRLSCMNEYYGAGLPGSDGQQYYSKLIIGMPQFTDEMFWSLRDEKSMVMLGFPPSPFNRAQQLYTTKKEDHSNERRGTYNNKIVQKDWRQIPNTDEIAKLDRLLRFDPLVRGTYTDFDKYILLKCRNHYRNLPQAFPIFLCAINWSDPEQVKEVYHMMKIWTPLPQDDALPLLDAHISDESVRYYATRQIGKYKDDELVLFMLELTQALMFEQTHFSPLGEMLIERSVMNPWVVGHELFWQLRSQLHIQPSFPRYSLILEQLLMLSGGYRYELMAEVLVNDEIMEVAELSRNQINKPDFAHIYRQHLQGIKDRNQGTSMLLPNYNIRDLSIEQCSIHQSLRVCYQLAFGRTVQQTQNITQILSSQLKHLSALKNAKCLSKVSTRQVLFKIDSDFRPDQLILQILRIIDNIWLNNGLDLRMVIYKVRPTLENVVLIECISAKRMRLLQQNQSALILSQTCILDYFNQQSVINVNDAIDNLVRSCAGYSICIYVLGIGDRHNDNLLITQYGHLFHINYKQILGDFRSKFGIRRNATQFLIPKQVLYAMGGADSIWFTQFQSYCVQAFLQIRTHFDLLINILLMMISAQLRSLQQTLDLEYIKQRLALNLTDIEAEAQIKREIQQTLTILSYQRQLLNQ